MRDEQLKMPVGAGENQRLSRLEAVLFAAGEEVSIRKLQEIEGQSFEEVTEDLKKLEARYLKEDRGICLLRTAESALLATKEECYDSIEKVLGERKKKKLSKASAEVLSIIAYLQPVTRVKIDEIRGVGSTSALQRLLDFSLIEEAGRLEAPGRPLLYRTTDEFLRLAGIHDLNELEPWEKDEA